ncbi:Peptidyl-prolyl isomerase cwc-27 [Wickerhamomyces ciferrii]|uniref:Peptidyl-prolyl isomerase cwc-27 n=1 Tax=Wickerhamomyces ciferrii (strain ATCC 14091 / BCRC 22168 / CBS 111 / JCM 3599 / NBRC 0793 / NRRL Y-1031 F-60-10) TaxID=1206466 RepID=K0KP07_WICCF|nr:Peptidyl-prolyl isomerase cwc-27 [Wickerhamomyces ciferrii]CCH47010.1 Peptidyl-prolyl isomerase cwc-27 [Wickerhamomyces ciferrii]
MSTLEPQTSAKARIHTTKVPIDVELWAKEAPITCRIFLTNVLNQKFNGWLFNRVLTNFIVQVDGLLNQELHEDEFNSRIRFNKRGYLGSINLGSRNSNTGKFFITLKDTPELNNKNTIFGKVVGDSIFNVIKISEGEVSDDGETPLYPVKITKSEILVPYFDDLVKEEVSDKQPKETNLKKTKKKKPKVKLSLGVDGEEGEEDTEPVKKIKMKSAHELLNDKKLSKEEAKVEETPSPQAVLEDKEESLKKVKDDVRLEDKARNEELQKLQEEIEAKKSALEEDSKTPEPDNNSNNKKKGKSDKQLRELETLKLLNSFKNKIGNSTHNDRSTKKDINDEKEHFSDRDDDFDNLDDSDSDTDIYSHSLKFEDNEKNKDIANEDLLITIDDAKDRELKKRRNDDFYKNQESSSILQKKFKR